MCQRAVGHPFNVQMLKHLGLFEWNNVRQQGSLRLLETETVLDV